MIKTLIVDDETVAREELMRLIRQDKGFQVVGEAANGRKALELIRNLKPDVVFLDIEMPDPNGLEVASQLAAEPNPPTVVFATAFHQYAIKAFELHAIDYILKPFDPVRIQKTLERLKEVGHRQGPHQDKLISLENELIRAGVLKKIVVHGKGHKDRIVLDPAEVCYFYMHYSEVIAYSAKDEYIVNSTLKELIQNLDPAKFVQTHKSYIVNLDKIEKVSPMFNGNFELSLRPPAFLKIPLSRRYAKNLKSRLGNW